MMKQLHAFVLGMLACWAPLPPLETLFSPFFKGKAWVSTRSGPSGPFAGRTALNSGTASVTVSTRQVNSDAIIHYGVQVSTVVASGFSGAALVVNSIVPLTSFAFARADGIGAGPTVTAMWEIRRTS